jgi:hypothetical protein
MAGLDPAIHAMTLRILAEKLDGAGLSFILTLTAAWIPGTMPGMTRLD